MREIKFRAWDKANKKMKTVTEIKFVYYHGKFPHASNVEGTPIDFWLNNDDTSYLGQEIELMQYTGLKDKNGKEIYEGDVIGDIGVAYVVGFDPMWGFTFKLLDRPDWDETSQYDLAQNMLFDKLSVMGNIYEDKVFADFYKENFVLINDENADKI